MVEIYLGTGGYSNPDWVGKLYPPEAKKEQWLELYAQHFNAVELNSSFYAIPGIKAFAGMVRKTQGRVRFAVKLHQSMTHERNATDDDFARLLQSVEPLREAGVLGPFLAQFPQSFHRTPQNRKFLATLAARFANRQQAPGGLAVEFRHYSWDNPEVLEAFGKAGMLWVSPDYPPLRGLPSNRLQLSGSTAYVRLSGRNKDTWWEGKDQSERHDYLYNTDELQTWVSALVQAQDEVDQAWFIFNNTTKGHALENLRMLKAQLHEAGL